MPSWISLAAIGACITPYNLNTLHRSAMTL